MGGADGATSRCTFSLAILVLQPATVGCIRSERLDRVRAVANRRCDQRLGSSVRVNRIVVQPVLTGSPHSGNLVSAQHWYRRALPWTSGGVEEVGQCPVKQIVTVFQMIKGTIELSVRLSTSISAPEVDDLLMPSRNPCFALLWTLRMKKTPSGFFPLQRYPRENCQTLRSSHTVEQLGAFCVSHRQTSAPEATPTAVHHRSR